LPPRQPAITGSTVEIVQGLSVPRPRCACASTIIGFSSVGLRDDATLLLVEYRPASSSAPQ
jgi:hypothetical protein